MKATELRTALHADPFRPFAIRMADGREYAVPHRDFLLLHPDRRIAIVATLDEGSFEVIDLPLVASLHFGNGKKSRRKRKAG